MTDADKSTYKQLVYPALGACQEVHKHLGPFLNEYMRLTGIQYGVLYNFAPVYAQCEKYHYDPKTFKMVAF